MISKPPETYSTPYSSGLRWKPRPRDRPARRLTRRHTDKNTLPGRASVVRGGLDEIRQDGRVADPERKRLGRRFDEVAQLYDRVRPGYPEELFTDLVSVTGLSEQSSVLEV